MASSAVKMSCAASSSGAGLGLSLDAGPARRACRRAAVLSATTVAGSVANTVSSATSSTPVGGVAAVARRERWTSLSPEVSVSVSSPRSGASRGRRGSASLRSAERRVVGVAESPRSSGRSSSGRRRGRCWRRRRGACRARWRGCGPGCVGGVAVLLGCVPALVELVETGVEAVREVVVGEVSAVGERRDRLLGLAARGPSRRGITSPAVGDECADDPDERRVGRGVVGDERLDLP